VDLDDAGAPPPLDRPVWVNLDRFYGEPDPSIGGVDDPPPGGYLKASGRVPGVLKWWTAPWTDAGSAASTSPSATPTARSRSAMTPSSFPPRRSAPGTAIRAASCG
jgi:hypothetical protein